MNRDYSISCSRFVAMCFIVLCHMMQRDGFSTNIGGVNIGWAWWFNVGVQMFLFLSGLLYGRKKSIETVPFYLKNMPKILVDYYVFIVVMIVAIYFSPLWDVDSSGVVGLLTFSKTISGLGHLWFVSTILFCYIVTPIFHEILNAIDERSDFRFYVEAILLVLVIHVSVIKFFGQFSPAWINCLVIGMIYSRVESKRKERLFHCGIAVLCIIMIPLQVWVDYYLPYQELPGFINRIYGLFCNYGHVFLGITLVNLIRFAYDRFALQNSTIFPKHTVLDWSDQYSYDVYLTHHVFVQSAFGCVEFISNRLIALPLAVLLTIITAVILHVVSTRIIKEGAVFWRRLPN